jgi:threonine dehydratase
VDNPLSLSLIQDAAERLKGRVVRTPLLSSPMLDKAAGCRLLVKAEALQRTGAFKYRGALNKLLQLDPALRQRGVVTFSAGNHGHAVAAAAAEARCPALIVLPKDAPAIKVENCRWWGAETVFYDPATQDREAVARPFVEKGMTLLHPFDDLDVMAGQGTAGLECIEQLAEQGLSLDALVVPCSGGGLASGTITAIRSAFPEAACYVVEEAGFAKMAASLATGTPQRRPAGPPSLLDGIAGPLAGTLPLAALRAEGAVGLAVTAEEALDAMAQAFRFLKLVIEPGGAAGLAAVLHRKVDFVGKTVAVVGSGGNVDPEVFNRAIAPPRG